MAICGKWKGSINLLSSDVVAHKILRLCGERNLKRPLLKDMITMTSCFERHDFFRVSKKIQFSPSNRFNRKLPFGGTIC